MDNNDDRRMPYHGHPISSPCEPDGSGALKNNGTNQTIYIDVQFQGWSVTLLFAQDLDFLMKSLTRTMKSKKQKLVKKYPL